LEESRLRVAHKKIEKIDYQPISAKDVLTRMKTYSELMIDLAYSALLFSNEDLSSYVLELENSVEGLGYQLLMSLSLSVRDKEDAEMSVGLFRVANAASKISNAAADIAALAQIGCDVHPVLKRVFSYVEETLDRAAISQDSQLVGTTIDDIWDKFEINVDLIATRIEGNWIVNPDGKHILQKGEVVFARGSDHEIDKFVHLATGKMPKRTPKTTDEPPDPLDRVMLEMKETSEFMVSLAYAAVTFGDTELAEEVDELEDRVDDLCDILTKEVLAMSENINARWGLINIAFATEQIADAAWEIAMVQMRGLPAHPLLRSIVDEAEEVVARVSIPDGFPMIGKPLEELALDDNYGIYILSIKREGHWFHQPSDEFHLKAGDTLIVDGYKEGLADLREDISKVKE
jgi:uncharacterized protein with PhoU and TrkA domain